MTTTPKAKVSFKTNPCPYDDLAEEMLVTNNDDITHLKTYIIIYYTTKGTEDVSMAYDIYLNEGHNDYDKYVSRYKAIKAFANEQVNSGEQTGYHLFGYVLRPFETQTLLIKNHHKKFQVKNKTYLNGPLKSNEFLAKKGQYYA